MHAPGRFWKFYYPTNLTHLLYFAIGTSPQSVLVFPNEQPNIGPKDKILSPLGNRLFIFVVFYSHVPASSPCKEMSNKCPLDYFPKDSPYCWLKE